MPIAKVRSPLVMQWGERGESAQFSISKQFQRRNSASRHSSHFTQTTHRISCWWIASVRLRSLKIKNMIISLENDKYNLIVLYGNDYNRLFSPSYPCLSLSMHVHDAWWMSGTMHVACTKYVVRNKTYCSCICVQQNINKMIAL